MKRCFATVPVEKDGAFAFQFFVQYKICFMVILNTNVIQNVPAYEIDDDYGLNEDCFGSKIDWDKKKKYKTNWNN